MADIFVSYARADKARVVPLVAALEAQGWSVWWDPEIPPGQEFDSLISNELKQTRAVIVVWTAASVQSRWVRGEARIGADRNILVPVRFDRAELPIDARAVHTTDLDDWRGDAKAPAFEQLLRAIGALLKPAGAANAPAATRTGTAAQERRGVSICVLPFTNMSGDAEQEYFSDGISEDIITDLSKVSALHVIARNTAFAFKSKAVDIKDVARQTGVRYVLEGSVRKSGNRVRITAQLIDSETSGHIWAERYDRELADIFALQDEISEAIVSALKLKLMPEEKKAIEQRGTTNLEAYNFYLMARQLSIGGNYGNARRNEAIIRFCQRAVELDPNYARAWALIADTQGNLRFNSGQKNDGGFAAAERALALDPNLAEAHAAKARVLSQDKKYDEAFSEVEIALRLDPESFSVNLAAAVLYYLTEDFAKSAHYFEKATELSPNDYAPAGMLTSCYTALGDKESVKRAAKILLARTEKTIAQEPDNGSALGFMVGALAILGGKDRARDAVKRAVLLDPDNRDMHYNMACSLITHLQDYDGALDLLDPLFDTLLQEFVNWAKIDPDLDAVRDQARFKAMIARAEARFAAAAAAPGTA